MAYPQEPSFAPGALVTRAYLPDRMRQYADRHRLASNHPIRVTANEAEAIAIDRRSSPSDVIEAFDAARDAWRIYTGENIND